MWWISQIHPLTASNDQWNTLKYSLMITSCPNMTGSPFHCNSIPIYPNSCAKKERLFHIKLPQQVTIASTCSWFHRSDRHWLEHKVLTFNWIRKFNYFWKDASTVIPKTNTDFSANLLCCVSITCVVYTHLNGKRCNINGIGAMFPLLLWGSYVFQSFVARISRVTTRY